MSVRVLTVTVLVAVAALAAPARAQLLSPGPLAAAHADIDTDDDCSKCHSSGKQVDASKCLECHKDLGGKIAGGRGLHGRSYKGQACEDCHVEHNGKSYKLVRWPGGAPDKLDHTLTGWKLDGKHAQTTCAKCHDARTKGGRPTYLEARTECGTCHKDPHAGRLGAGCAQCHNATKWEEVDLAKFDHGKTRYPLAGAHIKVDCAKCHGTPPKYAPLPFGTCDSCHKDPHVGQFDAKPCTKCHEVSSWNTADSSMSKAHPWLSLGGGHASVKCAKCHDKGNDKPPTKGKECASCHPNVHDAPFGKRCDQCHKSIRWLGLPREVGLAAHDKTKYPLEGRHGDVECAKCHSPKKPENERYRRVAFDRCAACHSDPHNGELVKLGADCASCHTVKGYKPTLFTVADHNKTAYALDGKHAVVACSSCHTTASPRVDLRVPGKRACADCHADPHAGQFAKEMADGGCAHCHSSDSWHQPKIDHSTFPLVGAHSRTACERCHGAVEKNAQAAAFRGIPRTCDGCHEDVHAGQFRTGEVKPCQHCHNEDGFKLPRFDHAKESGYALDGKHAQVACAKCHPTDTLRNGQTAVRYRLGYRKCKDCHANPHGEGL